MPESLKNHLTIKIKNKAKELGLYSCGISKADFLEEDASRLKKWLEAGYHGEMAYMKNHFEKRTDPRKLVENARSVISVLYNYYPKQILPENDNYKISKYAYGNDYHFVMKRKLKELMIFIKSEVPEFNGRVFVDSAPVLDRSWAAKSGLGWIGKNTCLITKEQGSFFLIGEVITDLELDYDENKVSNHCGGCTRCIDACPTGAIKPYELDSNKCISYWTIEHKGEQIPEEFKGKFNDWIFGCDICQDVCPWNRFAKSHNEPEFDPSDELMKMRKVNWEDLTEEQFQKLFKDSPLKRTRFKGLKRNMRFIDKNS